MSSTHILRVSEVRATARTNNGMPIVVEVTAHGDGVTVEFIETVREAPRVGDKITATFTREDQT